MIDLKSIKAFIFTHWTAPGIGRMDRIYCYPGCVQIGKSSDEKGLANTWAEAVVQNPIGFNSLSNAHYLK